MATEIRNTELCFSEKKYDDFMAKVYNSNHKNRDARVAKTVKGMRSIKTLNIDGKKYLV